MDSRCGIEVDFSFPMDVNAAIKQKFTLVIGNHHETIFNEVSVSQ